MCQVEYLFVKEHSNTSVLVNCLRAEEGSGISRTPVLPLSLSTPHRHPPEKRPQNNGRQTIAPTPKVPASQALAAPHRPLAAHLQHHRHRGSGLSLTNRASTFTTRCTWAPTEKNPEKSRTSDDCSHTKSASNSSSCCSSPDFGSASTAPQTSGFCAFPDQQGFDIYHQLIEVDRR